MRDRFRNRYWVAIYLFATLPFLSWSRPAPYYDVFGDVYRGFPLVYGLDQGDVVGEYLFLLAYFSWVGLIVDLACALACGAVIHAITNA